MLNEILITLFFAGVFWGVYIYLLYPAILFVFSLFKSKTAADKGNMPKVSVLIAAFNEESVLEERIKNLEDLDYDHNKLDILIGSDNSSDRTNEILEVASQKFKWLNPFVFQKRQGKAGVLNQLAKHAKSDILVFSDANTVFDKNSIKNLVKYFADPNVGGVCGRLILFENEEGKKAGVEESRYWNYETYLKRLEGKLGILMGANGGIFAIRKEFYRDVPLDKPVTDDFFISLNVLVNNKKLVYSDEAKAFEETGKNPIVEFKRKIRFAATNFQTITFMRRLIFNKNPLISFGFVSHKIMRWLFPFIMILLIISNLLLLNHMQIFLTFFILQMAFYIFAFIGFLLSKVGIKITIFSIPFFFCLMNLALGIGFFRFLFNKHSVIWQPTSR